MVNSQKLFLVASLFLILLSSVSAFGFIDDSDETFLGNFKAGADIELYQTCPSCANVVLESIQYPNGTIQLMNANMINSGNTFYYVLIGATQRGDYKYTTCADVGGGLIKCEPISFSVSSVGLYDNPLFYVLIFIISFSIMLLGIRQDSPTVTMLGGFGMSFLGIFTIVNGIGGVIDIPIAMVTGVIELAVGIYVMFRAGMGFIE